MEHRDTIGNEDCPIDFDERRKEMEHSIREYAPIRRRKLIIKTVVALVAAIVALILLFGKKTYQKYEQYQFEHHPYFHLKLQYYDFVDRTYTVITGLTEQGKQLEELVIPEQLFGYPVDMDIRNLNGSQATTLELVGGTFKAGIQGDELTESFPRLEHIRVTGHDNKQEEFCFNEGQINDLFSYQDVLYEKAESYIALVYVLHTEDGAYQVDNHVTFLEWNVFYKVGQELRELYVPESVVEIDRRAFEQCSDFTIVTPEGSYAEKYAKEKGISYRNE